MKLVEKLENLRGRALDELASLSETSALEAWRIRYLARQGELTSLLEEMKGLAKEDRPEAGRVANQVKNQLQQCFDTRKEELDSKVVEDPDFDATMPGRLYSPAGPHPVSASMERIIQIFRRMGYSLATGPDIENEFHNFDALNTPANHPARNEQDTFYLDLDPAEGGRMLLRTQTSPVQIRTMLQRKPPIRIIAPGRCYRRDEIDATHGMFFHQVEGLVVGENITLADLKGTLETFYAEFIGEGTRVRFRPHFFPFTEPSFEVDMSQPGTSLKGREWLEVCGCGMVDPAVFEAVGIDPERYTGFAFGMGVERMALMRHGIPDLRLFYENDLRFLGQFFASGH